MTVDTAEGLANWIRSLADGYGMAACGVADLAALSGSKPDLLAETGGDFPRAVVMGVRLQDAVMETVEGGPNPLYFHMYRQANYHLDRAAFDLATRLQQAGYDAMAIPASQIIGRNPMRGHLSHKLLGRSAGMGWIGRNSLLIHPQYGARMRYVSVLTNAPLVAVEPSGGSCGECRRCVEACPAAAIHEDYSDFDLQACYEKLTEFSKTPGIGQHICGVCVRACRGNRSTD